MKRVSVFLVVCLCYRLGLDLFVFSEEMEMLSLSVTGFAVFVDYELSLHSRGLFPDMTVKVSMGKAAVPNLEHAPILRH